MPLATPITIADEQNLIAAQLRLWAQPKGGSVEIMANQAHLWEKLFVITDAPRILVMYAGEALLFPERPDCHRVRRDWQVIVVRGHGFTDPMNAGPEPFATSLESVRDQLRVLLNISDLEELPSVIYKGIRPLPNIMTTPTANAFADAMMIEFSTMNDVPQIVLDAPGTEQLSGDELPP